MVCEMISRSKLILLVIGRVCGAGIAILASLLFVRLYGKAEVGSYFLHFSIAYLVAQVIRFGGENDILSAKSEKLVAQSIGVTVYATALVIMVSVVLSVFLPSSNWSLILLSGVMIAFQELYGDVLKRDGKNLLGVIYSSMPVHALMILFAFVDVTIDLRINLLLSSAICVAIGCYISKVSMIDNQVEFDFDSRHFLEAFQSGASNISAGIATPVAISFCTVFFGAATSADFRIAMRMATLINFTYLAFRQMLLRHLRRNGLRQFKNVAGLCSYVLVRVIPFALMVLFGNIALGIGLVYLMPEFESEFLFLLITWCTVVLVSVLLSPVALIMTYQRRFDELLRLRLLLMLVGISSTWVVFDLKFSENIYLFTALASLHIWLIYVPGVLLLKRYFYKDPSIINDKCY
jgi:hypothetical protein